MLVPTPYSILNDPNDGEDVFETIIPTTDKYYSKKRAALWARFHDTGLGNDDKAYWERAMRYRAEEIADRYDVKMRVFEEYLARLAANTGDVGLEDSKIESESINRNYDPPEVTVQGAVAADYLADQNKTDYTQKTYGGLESQTVRDYAAGVDNPFEAWAREFDKLFYWGI